MPRPPLLVLDDREGLLRASPGGRRLAQLADVRFLDTPLATVRDEELHGVRAVVAIRERTRLDAPTLARFPDLEIVLQTGGHAYHVDLEETARRGIAVPLWRTSAAPEAAMRELTFGLAIAALRRFPEAVRAGDGGGWPALLGGTLWGRRLGVLGMGRQGRAVAELGRAFGMDVVAWGRPGRPPAEDGVPRLPLEDVLATADVLSVNLRLTEDTRGLLDRRRLQSMKPGAVLVNTARGRSSRSQRWPRRCRRDPCAPRGSMCSPRSRCPRTRRCGRCPTCSSPPTSAGWSRRPSPSSPRTSPTSGRTTWPTGCRPPSWPARSTAAPGPGWAGSPGEGADAFPHPARPQCRSPASRISGMTSLPKCSSSSW